MNEKEKNCGNCKYFILYYINYRGLFTRLDYGHCVCEKVFANRKKRIYCDSVCDYWESNQAKLKAKHDSIEHSLRRMADELNHYINTLDEERRQ